MSRLVRLLAARMMSAASRLLPSHLSAWSRAMARELMEIGDDRSALLFAFGCLRAAAVLAIAALIGSLSGASRALFSTASPSTRSFPTMNRVFNQPRLIGLICGAVAVGMGMAYMVAAGAPSRHLLVNFAALVLGATAWLALGPVERLRRPATGPAILAMSVPLLLTASLGIAVDGASRWVSVGPLILQVSLILLPVMIVLYARRPDAIGTAGMVVAALALALQPDRAMAAALGVALLALAFATRGKLPIVAAVAAAAAFGWTLLTAHALPAAAYVDGILYTAFDVHPLIGAAVICGAAAVVAPGLTAMSKGGGGRAALLAFGGCWSTVLAAAALGNYPTPLVGYGGSAVLGYLLSVALLPGRTRDPQPTACPAATGAARNPDRSLSELRAVHPG